MKPADQLTAPLNAKTFEAGLTGSKADLQGLLPRFIGLLREILTLRQSLLVHVQPYPGLDRDLKSLLPPSFLRDTPYDQLAHLPRYLKAMKARAERWKQNPGKDAERASLIAPYEQALTRLSPAKTAGSQASKPVNAAIARSGAAASLQRFRWLVEEFRVSVFAQELGTAEPVSQVKLDRCLHELTLKAGAASAATDPNKPADRASEPPAFRPMLTIPEKKSVPLKNLSALDRLFPR